MLILDYDFVRNRVKRPAAHPAAELAGHVGRWRIETERGLLIQFPSRILVLYPHRRAVGYYDKINILFSVSFAYVL